MLLKLCGEHHFRVKLSWGETKELPQSYHLMLQRDGVPKKKKIQDHFITECLSFVLSQKKNELRSVVCR